MKRFKKIWNDSVFSGIIVGIFLQVIPQIITKMLMKVEFIKDNLDVSFPLWAFLIPVSISLFMLYLLISQFRINKKQNIKIHELENPPQDNRMAFFNNGDIVTLGNECFPNVHEFTVIGKTEDMIIVSDEKYNRRRFSPYELSTADEYQRDADEYFKVYTPDKIN